MNRTELSFTKWLRRRAAVDFQLNKEQGRVKTRGENAKIDLKNDVLDAQMPASSSGHNLLPTSRLLVRYLQSA